MPVIVTFSARVQRRHLENSYLGTVVVVVGPSDQVGRVQRHQPTSLIIPLPLPVLKLGTSLEDLIGTKWKPSIWSNVPTLQMKKLKPQEVKGCAYQHHSG